MRHVGNALQGLKALGYDCEVEKVGYRCYIRVYRELDFKDKDKILRILRKNGVRLEVRDSRMHTILYEWD